MTARHTNQELIDAYQQTGSVWRAGKALGLAGQTVHERLRAIGHPLAGRAWTDEEDAEVAALCAERVPIGEIAHRLGRTYAAVACRMSEKGISGHHIRTKKIPRGAGFDKRNIDILLRRLEVNSKLGITQLCRSEGLKVDTFVSAAQKHHPERWSAIAAIRAFRPAATCPYCGTTFHPQNARQRYCSRKCTADAKADVDYFGGRRRETVGLAQGVCQLCGRHGIKGLSSHHVLGKENDADNEFLVALCSGCHKLVTLGATRTFVDDPIAWQSFISLCWLRRHGHQLPDGELYVEVCLDVEPVEPEIEEQTS